MTLKDLDGWNEKKKRIDTDGCSKRYHRREVWWCALGVNIGSEQDGSSAEYRRPVLIITGLGPDTCLVAPLTTSEREHPMRPYIGVVDGKKARALLSQLRVIDTKRLVSKVGFLDKEIFEVIRKAVRNMI